MTKPLAGKSALVTGGSRGIGAAIVQRLAADGASVAFSFSASRKKADALVARIHAEGGAAQAIKADSGDPLAVRKLVASAVEALGAVDILVNNAGILVRKEIDRFDLVDFDQMVAVNIRAVFVAAQAVLPHMTTGGRIITIGSVSAERAGFPGASVYSMTKAAVAALTRGMARDLGPRGITVNTVQPGPTETDIVSDEVQRSALRPMMAIGRMGKDSEIASLVAYLAGPESNFITGSALTVDGGFLA